MGSTTVAPVAMAARRAPVPRRVVDRHSTGRGANTLRLTRRGRRVATVLWVIAVVIALAAVLVGVQALSAGSAQAGSRVRELPLASVVVRPGQTLWEIAGQVAPGADRRDVVARIVELNDLGGAQVQAGQMLTVPVVGR